MPPDGSNKRAALSKASLEGPSGNLNSRASYGMPSPDSARTSLLCRDSSRRLPRAAMRDFLQEIARLILDGRSVVCLLTTDAELRRLNLQFRGLDQPTDVLSFPAGDSVHENDTAGEIAISLDRASAQAAEQGHGLLDETRILMLHGVLHLAGMDHETDSGEMAEAEIRWRRRLDLPLGLIERSRQPGSRGIRKSRSQGTRARALPDRSLPDGTRA